MLNNPSIRESIERISVSVDTGAIAASRLWDWPGQRLGLFPRSDQVGRTLHSERTSRVSLAVDVGAPVLNAPVINIGGHINYSSRAVGLKTLLVLSFPLQENGRSGNIPQDQPRARETNASTI